MITVCPAYLHWGVIKNTLVVGRFASGRGKICPQGGGGFIRTSLDFPDKTVIITVIDKSATLPKESQLW